LDQRGKMRVDAREGKEAETVFRVLQTVGDASLIEARPYTGRTHQIRVHLAESGHPIVGDEMYGSPARKELGLRAIGLAFTDPFTRRPVQIRAPFDEFCRKYGFQGAAGLNPKLETRPPSLRFRRRKTAMARQVGATRNPKEIRGPKSEPAAGARFCL
jgi:hypothetical protein